MTIEDIYRGNNKVYRFLFEQQNPSYTGRPPVAVVTSVAGIYDEILAPIDISSLGVITETWTLTFVNATEYNCAGNITGFIGQGNVTQDFVPLDVNGVPYFSMLKEGWGTTPFIAADTVVFSTFVKKVAVDITDYVMTLTFVLDAGDTEEVPTVQVETTAGDYALDDPVNGLMFVEMISGESAKLVEDRYEYGFERRIPDALMVEAEDQVLTVDAGKVKIKTPRKRIVPA